MSLLQSKFVNDLTWLGYLWNPDMKLSHPRYHITADSCDDLPTMIYLGERYYLSTSKQTLQTNAGTLTVLPLTIYHFPCNVTFEGMTTSLSKCPETMTIRLPIFTQTTVTYVDWTNDDTETLQLHHKTVVIRPLQKVNDTLIKGLKELNKLYDLYNKQLSIAIKNTEKDIKNIKEDNFTSTKEILLYVITGVTTINSLFIVIICFCTRH